MMSWVGNVVSKMSHIYGGIGSTEIQTKQQMLTISLKEEVKWLWIKITMFIQMIDGQ